MIFWHIAFTTALCRIFVCMMDFESDKTKWDRLFGNGENKKKQQQQHWCRIALVFTCSLRAIYRNECCIFNFLSCLSLSLILTLSFRNLNLIFACSTFLVFPFIHMQFSTSVAIHNGHHKTNIPVWNSSVDCCHCW